MPFTRSSSPSALTLRLQLIGALLLISLGPLEPSQSNGVQALKLPSFFSAWMQPQSSASLGLQQPLSQQMSANKQSALVAQEAGDTDQMMTSGSQFEPSRAPLFAGPAQTSPLRRPFQSMLMLPSKSSHQIHLFTSLPKSLFGRFISGGASSGNSPLPAAQQSLAQQPVSMANQAPSWILAPPSSGANGLFKTAGEMRNPRFIQHSTSQLASSRPMHQQHRPQPAPSNMHFSRPAMAGQYLSRPVMQTRPKQHEQQSVYSADGQDATKHALGFGESGDFIMMDPQTSAELQTGSAAAIESGETPRELDQLQQGDSGKQPESNLPSDEQHQSGNSSFAQSIGDRNATAEVLVKEQQEKPTLNGDHLPKNETQEAVGEQVSAQNSSASVTSEQLESLSGKVLLSLNETQVATTNNQTNLLADDKKVAGSRPGSVEPAEEGSEQQVDQQGGLESATAAIIVAPADGQSIGEQLASEEQIEGFILGPYKGLTSDQDLAPTTMGRHQRAKTGEQIRSAQFGGMERVQQSKQMQQQPVGMTSMASNLIHQAKNLIQLPFVHMAATHSSPLQERGNLFRGQTGRHQQQAQPIDLLKESAFVTAANEQAPIMSPSLLANNYQPQRWPPAQFYGARESAASSVNKAQPQVVVGAWPPANRQNGRQQQQQQTFRAQPNGQSAANLQAGGVQQRQQADHNDHGYFLSSPQPPSFGQRPGQQQPQAPMRHQKQSLVPYFVEQTQPQSQQQQHFVQQPVQAEFSSHLINGTPQQASGFNLVIDHLQHERQQHRQPTHYFTEQSAMEHQLYAPPKFKSGLYQIDPPKLTDEQQQQMVVPESEDDAEKQMRAINQQQQVHEAAGADASEDTDEQDEQQQAATEPTMEVSGDPSNGSADANNANSSSTNEQQHAEQQQSVAVPQQEDDQTGGQRLSETKSLKLTQDITLYDFEMPPQRQQPLAGPSTKQRRPPPIQVAAASSGRQPLVSEGAPVAPARHPSQPPSGISFLDTQVYTIPYTLPQQQSVVPVIRGRGQVPMASGQYHRYSQGPRSHQPQNVHLGRFPLPYMAPPAPQPRPQQHVGGLMAASSGFRSQRQPIGNALFKALYQELGGHHQQQPQQLAGTQPFVPHQHQQLLQDSGEVQFQQAVERPEPQRGDARKQHFYHYQPVMVQLPVRNYQMKQQTPKQESSGGQQQYMFAIQHQPSSATTATAPTITTTTLSTTTVDRPEEDSANSEPTTTTTATEFERHQSHELTTTNSPQPASNAQEVSEDEREESLVQAMMHKDRQEDSPTDNRQQQAAPATTNSLVSSPSAFCADRAPGLYADESQKCKAYYQCAPTGHQMFRCNNQTQFNQKTQNCDWWYNVNCGGSRLSSGGQPEFRDQASRQAEVGTNSGERAEDASASLQQQLRQQIGSQESETTVQHQVEPSGQTRNSDSDTSNDQGWTKQEANQTPRVTSRLDDEQQDSLQFQLTSGFGQSSTSNKMQDDTTSNNGEQQQMAPTSATPSFAAPQPSSESPISSTLPIGADEQSQSQSTTQDPIVASSLSSLDGNSLTETPTSEVRPQVGAILSDELQSPPASTQAPPSSETTPTTPISETTQISTSSATSNQDSQQQSTTLTPATSERQNSSSGTANEEQPSATRDEQQQQQEEANNQQPQRLLVQSEFGLGVQQQREGGNTKSARSTPSARFEFTRRQAANLERSNLFTGSLSPTGKLGVNGEPFESHKYSLGAFDQDEAAEGPILYTSANQGSMSYMPPDQLHYLTAQGVQEAAAAETETSKVTSTTTPQPKASDVAAVGDPSVFSALETFKTGPLSRQKPKLDRRSGFGARLMSSTNNKSDRTHENRQQTFSADAQSQLMPSTRIQATTTTTTEVTTTVNSR